MDGDDKTFYSCIWCTKTSLTIIMRPLSQRLLQFYKKYKVIKLNKIVKMSGSETFLILSIIDIVKYVQKIETFF